MIKLTQSLILDFTVGTSAAIISGPIMFATMGASLKNSWRVGSSVFIGHAIVELVIFVLILIEGSSFARKTIISFLAKIGGLSLLIFGLVLIKKCKRGFYNG